MKHVLENLSYIQTNIPLHWTVATFQWSGYVTIQR